MGWWVFFITAWLTALLLVGANEWRRLYTTGIITMLILLPIDSTLIALGAFQFHFEGLKILGLPLPYWISYLPGGVLFAHFRPTGWLQRLLYIFLAAVLFTFIEFITIQLGLFQHLDWSLFNAFLLNIGGFTIILWFSEWSYSPGKETG